MRIREIPFSVPVTGVIRIDRNVITFIVNRTATRITLDPEAEPQEQTVLEPGKTMFDVLLASAREFLKRRRYNRFTGQDLYLIARETYPGLNKRSFMSRLIASTPNHPSSKHHLSKRDYFARIAPGIFSFENKYLPGRKPGDPRGADTEPVGEETR